MTWKNRAQTKVPQHFRGPLSLNASSYISPKVYCRNEPGRHNIKPQASFKIVKNSRIDMHAQFSLILQTHQRAIFLKLADARRTFRQVALTPYWSRNSFFLSSSAKIAISKMNIRGCACFAKVLIPPRRDFYVHQRAEVRQYRRSWQHTSTLNVPECLANFKLTSPAGASTTRRPHVCLRYRRTFCVILSRKSLQAAAVSKLPQYRTSSSSRARQKTKLNTTIKSLQSENDIANDRHGGPQLGKCVRYCVERFVRSYLYIGQDEAGAAVVFDRWETTACTESVLVDNRFVWPCMSGFDIIEISPSVQHNVGILKELTMS